MKVIFTYENGTSRVSLEPETPRDKSLLALLYPPGEQLQCRVSSPGDKGTLMIETSVSKKAVSSLESVEAAA